MLMGLLASPEESTSSSGKKPRPEYTKYQHVVVIGVDGGGAFFQDAETPNLDYIFDNSAVTYKCLASNPTISAQCWGSIFHGVQPSLHGLTNASTEKTPYPMDSKFPSFFRVVKENDPNAELASFSSWPNINTGIIEDGLGVHKVGGMHDSLLITEICSYLEDNTPKVMFVQFDSADGAGHSYGYGTEKHIEAIETIDGYIGQIYDACVENGMLDDTLFIVTADHGGKKKSHGGLTDAEKYVMFAATGKTVQAGEIQDIELRDTPAIVAYAFDYAASENWTSRVPSGLFQGVTAGARPVYVNKESSRYHESEATPAKGSSGYITNYIKNHTLKSYLTFDDTIADVCGGTTSESGKLYFIDGYYGKGVSLDDGYVSIQNQTVGNDSFSIAMWINTMGVEGDPCILSNKDWKNGKNGGVAMALTDQIIKVNAGNGTNRVDLEATLPSNYFEGWMHVVVVFDRENSQIKLSYDFGNFVTVDIPSSLQASVFDTSYAWNIGQDGTGAYEAPLPATLDELMIFDGAFTDSDISELSKYYGK